MKKIAIIVAVVLAIGAAIWSGLWFYGRAELDQRIDQQMAMMQRQGWTVTHSEREISGFPAGYEVKLTEVAAVGVEGALIKMPEVTGRAEAQGLGEVVFDLPETFTVDLPISETMRASNRLLPEVLKVVVESKGLKISAAGIDPILRSYIVTADQVIARAGEEGALLQLSAEVNSLDAGMAPGPGGRRFRVQSGQIAATMRDSSHPAEPRLGFVFNGLTATASLGTRELLDLFDPATAKDLFDSAFTSTAQEIRFLTNQIPGQPPLDFTYRAGAMTGLLSAGGGEVFYQAEEREITAALKTIPDMRLEVPEIVANAEVYQRSVTVPLSFPEGKPQPGSLRFSVLGLDADDALWSELDPNEKLTRGPAEISLDLETTFLPRPNLGLPADFSNVSLNQLELKALGAEISGGGDIEVLQPLNLPLGQIEVKLAGATGLLQTLADGAWIPRSFRDTAVAMLQVYARPIGETDSDRFETEITFETQGIFMNGLKLPD